MVTRAKKRCSRTMQCSALTWHKMTTPPDSHPSPASEPSPASQCPRCGAVLEPAKGTGQPLCRACLFIRGLTPNPEGTSSDRTAEASDLWSEVFPHLEIGDALPCALPGLEVFRARDLVSESTVRLILVPEEMMRAKGGTSEWEQYYSALNSSIIPTLPESWILATSATGST